VFSFERWHPQGWVRVHLNLGAAPAEVDLGEAEVLLSTVPGASGAQGPRRILRPHEGVVVGPGAGGVGERAAGG
jgi:hypothetical protein